MKAVNAQPGIRRRIGISILAACAVLLSSSCAAGQHAASAVEQPTLDGTNGTLGALKLEAVAIQAPSDPSGTKGTSSYKAGEDAELSVVIVNTGVSADSLTGVTSPAFSGWGIYPSADALSIEVADQTSGSAPTGAAATKPTTIGPGSALSFSLRNLGTDATGAPVESPHTLLLLHLTSTSSPLFPGTTVPITFAFAKAGATTLTVPVQLSIAPNNASISAPAGAPKE